MLKSLTIFLMLSITLMHSSAQETKTEAPSLIAKEDQLIVCITSDNWASLPSFLTAKPVRSRGFTFLAMADRMLQPGYFGFGFGLGFTSQNVHTDGALIDTGSASGFYKIPDSLHYELNKLSLNFITAALEVRIRSKENEKGNKFKLNVGIMAGYLLQSHTKYEDGNGKFKTYGIKHLNKFQYGLEGRLGYSNYALYGYYSFVNVFEDKKGPELIPYSLGISFTF